VSYYAATLSTYFFIDVIAAFGLSMQLEAGILNLGFIFFQALGAYTVGIVTLGNPSVWGGTQTYFAGWTLPFPLPLVVATLVGVVASAVVGVVILRRLRADYQAIALLSLMLVAYSVVMSTPSLVNGPTGLGAIPRPLEYSLGLSNTDYGWAFTGFCGVMAGAVFLLVRRVQRAPFGRLLAASRGGDEAMGATGKDVFRIRLVAMMVGGGLAALSGALLVSTVQAWSPGAWAFFETVVILAAVTVGGVGNKWGVLLGVAVVQILIWQAPTFLPQFGPPGFVDELGEIIIGAALVIVLWLRPDGLIPERRVRFLTAGASKDPASQR
jgi:branched-chain amino acid transport system permease protein